MVTVDIRGIRRTASALGGEGTNILRLKSTAEYDLETLDAALPEDPLGEAPTNGGWFVGPTGPALLVEGLADEVEAWVAMLAEAMTEAGIEGTITGAGVTGQPKWAQWHESRWLGLNVAVHRTSTGTNGKLRLSPATPDGEALIQWAMEWLDLPGTRLMANADLQANFWADRATTTAFMRQGLTDSSGFAHSYHQQFRQVRTAGLRSNGEVSFGLDSDTVPALEKVEALRAHLLNAPLEHVANANISHRHGITEGIYEPDAAEFTWTHRPEVWSEYVLVPAGIQVLTNAHLQKAADLSGWRTTRLGPNHSLVEARDLSPWYTDIRPYPQRLDPELTAAARHDFGGVLFTVALVDALGLRVNPDIP